MSRFFMRIYIKNFLFFRSLDTKCEHLLITNNNCYI